MNDVRLLSLKQVAEILGVSYSTAQDYVCRGLLRSVKLPRRSDAPASEREERRKVQVSSVEVERFIEDCTRPINKVATELPPAMGGRRDKRG